MSENGILLSLMSTTDYIEWLIEFTKNKNNFSDRWLTISNKNDVNRVNVKKLSYFYQGIDNYARSNHIYPIHDNSKYYYNIKYNGISFQIGYMINQEMEYFCNRVPLQNENGFIDFFDILTGAKQNNVDMINETLNSISNVIITAYENGIPIESIINSLDNTIKELNKKENDKQKSKSNL